MGIRICTMAVDGGHANGVDMRYVDEKNPGPSLGLDLGRTDLI